MCPRALTARGTVFHLSQTITKHHTAMAKTTLYPGRDTEFFIMLGGMQNGPIRGLVELFKYNISPDTPVWYDGLPDWKPAMICPLTQQLFDTRSEFFRVHPEALVIMQGRLSGADPSDMPALVPDDTPDTIPAIPESVPEIPKTIPDTPTAHFTAPKAPHVTYVNTAPSTTPVRRPSTYLAWSIVMTLLCCMPAGIVAIIFSCRVSSKWAAGDIEAAQRASERAQLWIVLSFILGLITSFAMIIWSPVGAI